MIRRLGACMAQCEMEQLMVEMPTSGSLADLHWTRYERERAVWKYVQQMFVS